MNDSLPAPNPTKVISARGEFPVPEARYANGSSPPEMIGRPGAPKVSSWPKAVFTRVQNSGTISHRPIAFNLIAAHAYRISVIARFRLKLSQCSRLNQAAQRTQRSRGTCPCGGDGLLAGHRDAIRCGICTQRLRAYAAVKGLKTSKPSA